MVLAAAPGLAQSENLVVNPGFESAVPEGWGNAWSREPGALTLERIGPGRTGGFCLEAVHTGAQDWCLWQTTPLAVSEGDIFELSGWIRTEGLSGGASYSVVLWDGAPQVMAWCFGTAGTCSDHDWQQVIAHFIIPPGCASINLRIVGCGPGTSWFDDLSLVKEGNLIDIRGPAQEVAFGNEALAVVFNTGTAGFTVTDRRNGLVYAPLLPLDMPVVMGAEADPGGKALTAEMWHPASDLHFDLRLETPTGAAEVRCELTGAGAMPRDLPYPPPFAASPGDLLVVPLNEGIIFPADDETVEPLWLVGYSGHGICMAWYGLSHGEQGPGVMAIVRTPDDMMLVVDRPGVGGNPYLTERPAWQASRGEFAYPRRIDFVFLTDGGYVSQAKRYREYAQEVGLYRSLSEKRAENPNVDLLVGAVNVWAPTWYGNSDPLALAGEMRGLGMERLLWSEGASAAVVSALNDSPWVLTSRYDIYQDVWPPDAPPWALHEGWPEDLVLLPDATPMQGWVIRDGETLYPGGVVCSPRGLEHAQAQIPADLAATPYRCRFIDTTTASYWKECYSPDHPTTRSEDKFWKMELLRFCSQDMGMVTGSETGIDCSVPYLHYFEGMLSLGPYRLPDCGYTLIDYVPPTPDFLKYQVGPYYRVPLWELVYHDCVVSYWYWGDSTNKAPEVWDQRDLINALYGTPPLFMLSPEVWDTHKFRFAQTYHSVCPTARRLGYDRMLSHEFLTPDHTLQRTTWSSGTTVIGNFADHPQVLPDGARVPAVGWLERGYPFYDVLVDFWARNQIVACHEAGVVAGYGDHTYRPCEPVDRGQMAVYIARTLAGGDEQVPAGPGTATFPDVPTDYWAFKYVEYAAANSIVAGYPGGNYQPTWPVDRGQMAVFVARAVVSPHGEEGLIGYTPPATPTFSDVASDHWAYLYIEYIAQPSVAVTQGYPDGTYRPATTVTRDQMAVYVQRAFDLPM
jgi:hypothetical protein